MGTDAISQVMMTGVMVMGGMVVLLALAIGGVVWARRHYAFKGE